jgi:phospholipase/carboxylesterase
VLRLAAAVAVVAIAVAQLPCYRTHVAVPGEAPPADSAFTEAAGVRFLERITGGARVSDPLPLVVVMHGFGGSPENVARLLADYEGRARVILPYGLHPLPTGFSWFVVAHDKPAFDLDAKSAADRVAAMIVEIVKRRPTVGKAVVTGFSQGGMMSYTLAATHPELVGTALPVSGLLAPGLCPSAWPAGADKPVVHAFHGTADVRVPFADGQAAVACLKAAGLTADLTEFPGLGHHITADVTRAVGRAVAQATAGP